MVWALVTIATAGVLIGSLFKVSALVGASMIIVVAGLLMAALTDATIGAVAMSVLAGLTVLQGSYLLGLFVNAWMRKPGVSPARTDAATRFDRTVRTLAENRRPSVPPGIAPRYTVAGKR